MIKIKILQVFTILNRGGAESNMMNYFRLMNRDQFQVDFLVHRVEIGAYESEILARGSRIFRLPAIHPLHLRTYKKAVALFFEEHSDYDIIHGQLSELGVFIYEEAKRRKIPVIIAHAHSSSSAFDFKFLFRTLWIKRIRNLVNSYFGCNEESIRYLFGENMIQNYFLMKNAIDLQKFIIEPYQDQNKKLKLIHVGSLTKVKNHTFLLDVFSEVVKRNANAKLYLVGEGALKNQIQAQVSRLKLVSQVHFLGVRSDVPDLLKTMDVFLFPSLFEGLPVALIEAQASGIRCVISDTISKESLLIEENVKVLPLKQSAARWAEALLAFSTYERQDQTERIREKGYAIEDNVPKLEAQYRKLVAQFKGKS